MVTKIISIKNIGETIRYNENKVRADTARCIYAGNFLKDAETISLPEKQQRFDDLLALNRRAKCRAYHIIAGFTPDDVLSTDKLIDIACEYMDRIGFGDQPFLVYLHFDTGVPHLHIVTTPIKPDGTSLNKSLWFKHESASARKALEEKYGLVKARRQKGDRILRPKTTPVEKLQYGKHSSSQAITNILEYILPQFHYRSFSGLNAILSWYNLAANPGKPGTRMYRQGGLLYHVLNDKGQDAGTPLRASAIYFNPGLKWLNAKFKANAEIDPARIWRTRSVLDATFRQQPGSWPAFVDALSVEQIAVSPCFDAGKFPDDLSFVDWEGKMVINASEMGNDYSARQIWQRLGLDPHLQPILLLLAKAAARTSRQSQNRNEALNLLFRQEESTERMPYELSRKANQKKKGKSQKL